MKALLYIFLTAILTRSTVNAQVVYLPTKEGKVLFESIDTCSLNKNLLYSNAKVWYANAFNDSKYVLEVDDKDNGIIMGKGVLPTQGSEATGYPYKFDIYFTIRIDVKDYKYRTQFYDLSIVFSSSPGKVLISEIKKDASINPDIIRSMEFIMNDLKKAITKEKTDF